MQRRFPRIPVTLFAIAVLALAAFFMFSRPAAAKSIDEAPGPALKSDTDPARPEASFESSVLKLINAERSKRGLKKLTLNSKLAAAAEKHSQDMAKNDYFSHTSQNGAGMSDRLAAAGYKAKAAGETIYAGGGSYNTPAQCVKAWMNSAGHRAILLSKTYTQIGIGYAYNADSTYGGYYTADLGKP